MNATPDMTLHGGIDVGNGYVKAVIENATTGRRDVIDMPSSVSVMTRPNQLPVADEEAPSVLRDADPGLSESSVPFYNQLDASFKSALVPDSYRRVFGTRSLTADGAFEEFDTLGRASKAKQPLSKVLVLGVFAAKALRDHVQQYQALPHGELQVTARAALALPINEFMRHREVYAAELCTEAGHLVVIENFETPVVVRLPFVVSRCWPRAHQPSTRSPRKVSR